MKYGGSGKKDIDAVVDAEKKTAPAWWFSADFFAWVFLRFAQANSIHSCSGNVRPIIKNILTCY